MALVWTKTVKGTCYEVRNAGASLRLYSNGIFHSQWNPKQPFSGQLWDLLSLPAFFNHHHTLSSSLILGVGGGAVINALSYCFSCKTLRGVDLDTTHLSVAKRFFIEKKYRKQVELIENDADSYVRLNKKKYDYIVEDLFIENPQCAGDARRAIKANQAWFSKLSNALTSNGILVSNFENDEEFHSFLKNINRKKLGFKTIYCFQTPRYENAIGVFSKRKVLIKELKHHMRQRFGEQPSAKILSPFIIEKY